jgi:hypothetical protein
MIRALFGIQQAIEGGPWLTLPNKVPHLVEVLTHIYACFRMCCGRFLFPCSLSHRAQQKTPTDSGRPCRGAIAGIYLLYFWALTRSLPSLRMRTPLHIPALLHWSDSVVLCAGNWHEFARFQSCRSEIVRRGHRRILGLAGAAYAVWFILVWCFFAAVLSVTVLLYFRSAALLLM